MYTQYSYPQEITMWDKNFNNIIKVYPNIYVLVNELQITLDRVFLNFKYPGSISEKLYYGTRPPVLRVIGHNYHTPPSVLTLFDINKNFYKEYKGTTEISKEFLISKITLTALQKKSKLNKFPFYIEPRLFILPDLFNFYTREYYKAAGNGNI